MAGKESDIEKLQQELQGALALIESTRGVRPSSATQLPLSTTNSLLERCSTIVANRKSAKKPVLRIIHHLACTGGTLISKCLSGLPNVFLLSELNPQFLKNDRACSGFAPVDIIRQAKFAGVPQFESLAKTIFVQNLKLVEWHVRTRGGLLIVRDHTHSDYTVGGADNIVENSTLANYMDESFRLKRVVTIRNPVDSYLSLIENGWEHYDPKGFEEYCRRYLVLLSKYAPEQIMKYEDFVDNPSQIMSRITEFFEMKYTNDFANIFDVFSISGDSGRSRGEIAKSERREMAESLRREIQNSTSFIEFCQNFGYDSML